MSMETLLRKLKLTICTYKYKIRFFFLLPVLDSMGFMCVLYYNNFFCSRLRAQCDFLNIKRIYEGTRTIFA